MVYNQLKLFLIALLCVSSWAADCSVRIRGSMTAPTPLILRSGTDKFVIPNQNAEVVVRAGATVDLWCSGSFTSYNAQLLTATCVSGVNFKVNGATTAFKNLACRAWPDFTAENTGRKCEGGGSIIRVGFKVSSTRFVEQYTICFNTVNETPLYSKYTLGSYSKHFQSGVDRIQFRPGTFFGTKNVEALYTKNVQTQTITTLLGTNANKYITSTWSLSRGHLAPKSDFAYGAQQLATFSYANVAPQWQPFNSGNWGDMETLIRDYANYYGLSLVSYTGTHGVASLPDNRGAETPLYLGTRKTIPVPKLFYRVVVDEASGRGVALVTVNDPYKNINIIKRDFVLCTDVSSQLSYFRGWSTYLADASRGYSYACTVPDFLKKVKTLPALRVSGILA